MGKILSFLVCQAAVCHSANRRKQIESDVSDDVKLRLKNTCGTALEYTVIGQGTRPFPQNSRTTQP